MTHRTLHRPPDDPTIFPDPEKSLIRFERCSFGRETAWLGPWLIGEVIPILGGRIQQATVLIYLPGLSRKQWPASTVAKGRERIVNDTRDWIEAAGLRA